MYEFYHDRRTKSRDTFEQVFESGVSGRYGATYA
jgi:hypothetical protein